MNLKALLPRREGRAIEVGLVGAGEFGRTFLSQARRVPGLSGRVACDREPERAVAAIRSLGIPAEEIRRCETLADARRAFEEGRFVVLEDAGLLIELPLDLVVEATGHPEAAAAVAEAALAAGRHVAMVTKEADSVVGPLLARRARAAGLVFTPVDGDQPSLLMGLVGWAGLLGLEIVSAGKASEYDFVFDPESGEMASQGRRVVLSGFPDLWRVAPGELRDCVAARADLLGDFWHRSVPDLCEMTLVANATGLLPDVEALHAPVARTVELPDLFALRSDGGLLERSGTLDIFNCLRRPDELSFAGGVYLVARTPDEDTGRLFAEKGIPVSADRRRFLLHNPVHLLGAEAPLSVLSACLAGKSTGGEETRPLIDLTARAEADIPAGTCFALGRRHAIPGLAPAMTSARPLGADAALPYYLLPGATARVEIPAGAAITAAMVEPPADSVLWRLRREQDAAFFS